MSYSFRFPFSIFMYQAPLKPASPETKPVLKVVKYGNTLLALPDEARVVVKSVNVEHFSARRLSSTAIDHLKRRSRGGWSHIVFINSGVQSYRFYSLCPTPPTSKHAAQPSRQNPTLHAKTCSLFIEITTTIGGLQGNPSIGQCRADLDDSPPITRPHAMQRCQRAIDRPEIGDLCDPLILLWRHL